jgi:uncharacterized protein YgbK (DUF1537 family)
MTNKILLGCIADDFTGATDLANNLVRTGFRVTQINGVPTKALNVEADAVVIALKSRTIPAGQAIEQSLAALHWLQAHGAQQIYFKYCSTFDSTPAGNIGPVADALMKALQADFTIATPAFPDNGRTVFKGHLFVGDQLLSDSGMKDHPLTPMRDANLVRVLQAQTNRKVGLVDHKVIAAGTDSIAQKFSDLRTEGVGMAIVDAVSNDDLIELGKALKGLPLVTAGSGVAIGLAQNFGLSPSAQASALPSPTGYKAIVSGSCSLASNRQVAHFKQAGLPAFGIDPSLLMPDHADVASLVAQIRAWAKPLLNPEQPILVYATADAATVSRLQQQCDAHLLGSRIEQLLGKVAQDMVEDGVGQLIVAGGETSGACVQALAVDQMQIGPQIDPGVPWCFSQLSAAGPRAGGLHLTLKSGNFGTDDFFTKAFGLL